MRMQLDLEGLKHYATRLARQTAPQPDAAIVITLSGELGAGKTTFTQAFAKALGVEESVTSPTFVIEKIYQLPYMDLRSPYFKRLVHIDAYRLKSSSELEAIGFQKLLHDPGNIILLEWPERVSDILPKECIRIRFDITNDGRIITSNGEEKIGN